MCKISDFQDEMCAQEDCPQVTTTMQDDDDTRLTILMIAYFYKYQRAKNGDLKNQ